MSQKKHIVLITTWYPPLQSIAVNRMLAFAKYIDHSKYTVSVVTLGTKTNFGHSSEDEVSVYRIKPQGGFAKPEFTSADSAIKHKLKVAWRILRQRIMGNEDRSWAKKANVILDDLHSSKPIDLIISSFSPVAPHLVALNFKKKFKSVKWIVDMRDEMSLNPQSDAKLKSYYQRIEKEIELNADALTSVSEPIVNYFKDVIQDLKAYVEIRNGFDHDMPKKEIHYNDCLTFLHAGSFYGTRKPTPFFDALVNLNKQGKLPEQWKFICAGAARNFSIPSEIENHVELIERVSQDESLAMMSAADMNVLIQPPTGRNGVFTGKLFDYLSVCQPVFAVVDPGDVAATLISSLNAGYICDFTRIQSIESILLKAIEDWKTKQFPQPDLLQIEQLHRKIQIQKLNLLIDRLLNES